MSQETPQVEQPSEQPQLSESDFSEVRLRVLTSWIKLFEDASQLLVARVMQSTQQDVLDMEQAFEQGMDQYLLQELEKGLDEKTNPILKKEKNNDD